MGCFCFRNKEASTSISQTPVIDEEVSHIQNTQLFTYKELQLATDDFCPTNKVGQGGFGSVYKRKLISSDSISQTGPPGLLLQYHIGYLAPEYALRGQLNRKADIYSFGVLLLEIVTGRSNTNRRLPIAEQYLLEKAIIGHKLYVKHMIKGQLAITRRAWQMHDRGELVQLVDMDLNGDFNPDEACKYLKVSLLCTQDKPKLRPQMSTVVKMLLGEIDVDDQEITKPGLLSEFMSIKVKTGQKNKHASSSGSADSDNHSSFSTGHMDNSHGTMTFNSIYDRTN
ncbi:hypothetical protein ACFE04_005567 [Oxalis oulophora]